MRDIFYKYLYGLLLILIATPGFSQEITVKGIVTDAADGQPLTGVNVLSQQNGLGTISDFDGVYIVTVDQSDTLHFSYIGYSDMLVAIAGRTEINLQMTIDAEVLDEVVVIGYGTQKKSDLTGSVSTIKGKELTKIPSSSIDQALQGKVSGVQVTQISGEPGAAAVIRIRGVGTLNDASPLFVVDGMLLDDINFLNPYDVESVEVLKDASATAIYGSRGANGVIIITTKKGVETGDARIELSAYYGSQRLDKKIALTNAGEFAVLANEVAANEGTAPPFDNPEEIEEGTDWQDEIFQSAPIMNYQLAISGASDRMDYRISGNYFKQQGIVKGSDFQRFTLRLNNNYKLSSWARIGHNISLIHRNIDVAADVISSAYRADPTVPPIDSMGNFGNTSARSSVANPVAQIAFNNNSNFGNRAVGNFFIDLKMLKDFTFRSNFGIDLQYNQGKIFVPEFFVSAIQQNDKNRLSIFSNRSQSWLWDNTITYDKEWKQHRLNILGGITAQEFQFEDFGGLRQGLPGESDELWYLSAGEIDGQTNYNSAFEWSMLSYLFRTNYTYDNRLLFTATLRVDGSSKFGKNNRYGYFPSFALGWNISQEGFMQSVDFVSRLKLRSSWGVIGNEKIGAYAGRAVVTSNLNAVLGNKPSLNFGASIITLANANIRWEETNQFDIGLEMGFLNNRLSAVIDYYDRVTDGILIDVPIPNYIGSANNPVVNAAKVKNSGIDFDLNWRETKGKFSYSVGLIASTVKNEVLELGEGKEEIFGGDLGVGGKLGTRTVVGLPIGAFYGYETNGIFQTEEDIQSSPTIGDERPGDLRFVDQNGDGQITTDDRVYLGSPIPDFIYGFHIGANYAGFDFSIDFNGQSGNKIINAKKMARFGTYNFEDTYLDHWTGEGTSDSEPMVTNGGHNYNVSDRFIENGNFSRLRNIQIGYSLPIENLSKIHMSGLRFYVSGTNLVTWSEFSGYTPEITSNSVISVGIDRGVYPIAKTIIGGLTVTF